MRSTNGLGLAVVVFAVLGIVYYFTLPAYPKISPMAYEYATALYSACNQETPEKLDVLTELIDRSHSAREIDAQESKWLHAIVDRGRDGQWQKAVAECRVMLECQVDKDVGIAVAAD